MIMFSVCLPLSASCLCVSRDAPLISCCYSVNHVPTSYLLISNICIPDVHMGFVPLYALKLIEFVLIVFNINSTS